MRSRFARRAAGAAWWSAIEIVSRTGVQFIVTLVLARLLLPRDFGLVALLMIFTGVGAILVDSGFGTALIQRQRTTPDDETTVFAFSFAMAACLWVLLVLAAPLAADFFHVPQLSPLLRVASLVLLFGGLGAVPDALLTTRLNFRARTVAQLVASTISGALAIALAVVGFGVWSLVWQLVIASVLRTGCLWFFCKWRPRGRVNATSFRSLGRFGSFMLLSSLLNAVYVQVQPLLIGRMFDTRTLGFYTLAQNSQQAPLSLMGGVLTRVGLPVFSALADQPGRLIEALRPILRLSMFVFVPCMVGLAVLAKPLVLLIYGTRWLPAAPVLGVLAIAGTLWPLHVLNLEAIKALGRSDLFFRLAVIKIALATTLVVVGSPWGPIGIAWAVVVASAINAGINTFYSWKLLDYGPLAQAIEQIPTFALSALAALVGWCILYWIRIGPIAVLPAIAGAAMTYLGAARIFKVQALADLVSFLHALRANKAIRPESEAPA
jgi:O-antigen/teichoic acid export membrane protein